MLLKYWLLSFFLFFFFFSFSFAGPKCIFCFLFFVTYAMYFFTKMSIAKKHQTSGTLFIGGHNSCRDYLEWKMKGIMVCLLTHTRNVWAFAFACGLLENKFWMLFPQCLKFAFCKCIYLFFFFFFFFFFLYF